MSYQPAPDRYDSMPYAACGRSGLTLPRISLGLWHNFGDTTPASIQREMVATAFDLGITHFDLANNYGPPYGSAEVNFGRILREDLAAHRDELVISSKAGWDMWPGPYGQGGGSRKYVLASLDQSLKRIGLENLRSSGYAYQIEMKYRIWRASGQLAETNILFVERRKGTSKISSGRVLEGVTRPFWCRIFLPGKPSDPKRPIKRGWESWNEWGAPL